MRANTMRFLQREFKFNKAKYINKDKESLLFTINSLYTNLELFRERTTNVYLENEYLRRRVVSVEKKHELLTQPQKAIRTNKNFTKRTYFRAEYEKKIQKAKDMIKEIKKTTNNDIIKNKLTEVLKTLYVDYRVEDFVEIDDNEVKNGTEN